MDQNHTWDNLENLEGRFLEDEKKKELINFVVRRRTVSFGHIILQDNNVTKKDAVRNLFLANLGISLKI